MQSPHDACSMPSSSWALCLRGPTQSGSSLDVNLEFRVLEDESIKNQWDPQRVKLRRLIELMVVMIQARISGQWRRKNPSLIERSGVTSNRIEYI
jgi:hypothetical protein